MNNLSTAVAIVLVVAFFGMSPSKPKDSDKKKDYKDGKGDKGDFKKGKK